MNGTTGGRLEYLARTAEGLTPISFSRSAYRSVFSVCSQEYDAGETVAIMTVFEAGFTKESRSTCEYKPLAAHIRQQHNTGVAHLREFATPKRNMYSLVI